MKSDNRNVNRFFIFISGYLLLIFIISAVVSFHQTKAEGAKPDEVCAFARQFLSDGNLQNVGKEFDCSQFTRFVYKKFNYKLPRSSAQQFKQYAVKENTLKPGDLVFFSTDKKMVGHVGIYLKNNSFIHSPGKNQEVRIDNLSDTYWKKHYMGSGSVIESKRKR